MASTTGTELIEVPSSPTQVDLSRKDMVGSRLWPTINTREKAAVIIARARSYGMCPTVVADGFYFVSGKPAMSAQLIATLVKKSDKYNFRVREKTDKKCKIEFFEREGDKWESLGTEEFTMDMAKRAGLASAKNVNWTKFPEAMLWARCLTAGVRARCPDALGGGPVYCVEELSPNSPVDADGRIIIDVEPEVAAPGQTPPSIPPARDVDKEDVLCGELLDEIAVLIEKTGADCAKIVEYVGCPLEQATREDLEDVLRKLKTKKGASK